MTPIISSLWTNSSEHFDVFKNADTIAARFDNPDLARAIAAAVETAFVRGQTIGTTPPPPDPDPTPDPDPDPNPDPDPDPNPADPDPTTTSNPRGTQSEPNLAEPLRSIDWGWEVADQLPETAASHDIRVYFVPGGETVTYEYSNGFSLVQESMTATSWSTAETAAAMSAFEEFENVADLNFIQVSDIDNADFVMVEGTNVGGLGFFLIGDSNVTVGDTTLLSNGVGVFDNSSSNSAWNAAGLAQGGYAFLTLVHEIGHGVGLAHPHDNGGSATVMEGVTSAFGDYGTHGLNQGVFTVMTYNDGWADGPNGPVNPSAGYGFNGGLMTLDIAVLQDTYGANTTTGAGDTTYVLPEQNEAGTFYSAIWDVSGTDTMVYNGEDNAIIDLRAATLLDDDTAGGFISYAAGIHGGFTIANGVVIENGTGGNGDDTITGNAADNVLTGNAGDDNLTGGEGADTFVFLADTGDDTITDFADDEDRLQLEFAGAIADSDAAMGFASQVGNNVVFDFNADGTVTVEDITIAEISDDVFVA